MYRRLPRGPHGLDARQIAAHQRTRIQGALVEAVARDGYERLTVRSVIGLAGVSRRSFYEHFENRHDCFVKTAAALARSELAAAREAAVAGGGPADARVYAGFASLAAWCEQRPDAARLVLAETVAAGDAGATVLIEALAAAERELAAALGPARAVPAPILRAVVGGAHGAFVAGIEQGSPPDPEELTAIVLAQRVPPERSQALARLLHERSRRAAAAAERRARAPRPAGAPRERILRGALRLAAEEPTARLNLAEIADASAVAVSELVELFDDAGECLDAALEDAASRLVAIAARACEVGADPAETSRLALAGLLGHLAAEPAQARGLALVAHRAGPVTAECRRRLDRQLGAALATRGPEGAVPPAAAAGALWHLVRTAALAGRLRVLPALSDHLSYALLAPALGAGPTIEALTTGTIEV
ncbi:MAG TPA: TetR/AcrR family transcriptional regulator [Solirubrobacteraceae bacterium]|nr:TetR/AcrR family transcriptional regulator [Solirubrobacteraceae bacterium]